MTDLLDKAFQEARKLPQDQQDVLGAIILEEIADEARWAKSFMETREELRKLADDALADFRAGRTTALEFPPGK